MTTHFIELCDVLDKLLKLYTQVFGIAQSINNGIRANDRGQVQANLKQYDQLLFQVADCEEKRLAVCDALSKELGITQSHVNVSRFCMVLPAPQSTQLDGMTKELKVLLQNIKMVTTSNQILLEESLRDITKIFEIAVSSKNKFSGYCRTGNKNTKAMDHGLVNHIA